MKKINGISGVALSALFTALLSVCAMITVPGPIPFTMQTFAVFMIAGLLPLKYSLPCYFAYLFLGIAGLPVFSGFSGGFGVIIGPTGGYLLGFLLLFPTVRGTLKLLGKKYLPLCLFFGLIVCYAMATVWYVFYASPDSILTVTGVTVLPFIIPDFIKLLLASLIIKRIGRIYEL